MRDFARQALAPELAADELVACIRLQSWPEGHGCGFHEVARRHGHAAIAAGMALVTLDGAGRIDRLSLTVTGSTRLPVRLVSTERHLAGRNADPDSIAVAAAAAAELPARDDPLVPSWYRQRMAGVAVRRAFAAALSQARTLP
jgi:CO/xanthine dehydrogenase FAD-binding subunit